MLPVLETFLLRQYRNQILNKPHSQEQSRAAVANRLSLRPFTKLSPQGQTLRQKAAQERVCFRVKQKSLDRLRSPDSIFPLWRHILTYF